MPRRILIDTDTASDDAVALIMALRSPEVEVEAITAVSGNVPLAQVVTNALYTAELCGSSVPVYPGADKPLKRPPQHALWFHGPDGMGKMNYPPPVRKAETTHAVDAIIDLIRSNPGIEVVTLGPLTNLALAISQAPDIVHGVRRCIAMGGAPCTVGNVTPAAEYNIWVDPEAADIVFRSALKIEMVGWEICRGEANLNSEDIRLLREFDTPYAHFAIDCNRTALQANKEQSGETGIPLPDPTAMGITLDPSLCLRASAHWVRVETVSELTRGMTVVDQLNVAHDERNREIWKCDLQSESKVNICWKLDVPRWKELLFKLLK